GHDNIADILCVPYEPKTANVVELSALRVEAPARIGVVAGELLGDLRYAHPVRKQLVGIEQHLILHGGAAKTRLIRYTLNGTVMPVQHPIVDGLQFLGRTVGTLQNVAVD